MLLHLHNRICLILLTILLNSCASNAIISRQKCAIKEKKGLFLYEKSSSIISYDDMIFRHPSIVQVDKFNMPDYNNGLFITTDDLPITLDNFSCNNAKFLFEEIWNNSEKVKLVINELSKRSESDLRIGDHIFTSAKLQIKYLYIGIFDINFIEKEKIIIKKIPIFVLLEIKLNQ
ncbi:hypothetical protein PN465_15720 [Nodularia spumigena CS-584]|nr:hypothetical protein [Nodularia spumigena]MDB9383653.1 hypothetical protein [Nodularia spumigena CS-584]PHK17239.1 hypothetical protein VF12_39795 [Nostoc linckia z15]